MFCISAEPVTGYNVYSDSDLSMVAVICARGLDKALCRAVNGVKSVLSVLRRMFSRYIRACIEGTLRDEQVYREVGALARRVATGLVIGAAERLRVDTQVVLLLYCGGAIIRSAYVSITMYARHRRGGIEVKGDSQSKSLEWFCSQVRSGVCSGAATLVVDHSVKIRYLLDERRVTGGSNGAYVIIRLGGNAEDRYILAAGSQDVAAAIHASPGVFVSLERYPNEEEALSVLYSASGVNPFATVVRAVCSRGTLYLFVNDGVASDEYPVVCADTVSSRTK